MRVPVLLGAAIFLAATQLASAAALAPSGSLLAVSSANGTRVLLHVDARTLAPVDGRSLALDPTSGSYLRSADKSLLAFSAGNQLRFVDTVRMVETGKLQTTAVGTLRLISWPTPRRLLVLGFSPSRTDLFVVDPVDRTLIARTPLPGGNSTVVALPDGIAYLAWPYTGIFPARVVIVKLDGTSRSVTVARIRSGIHWHLVRGVQVGDIRQPGLTADPAGGKAYLVDAGNLVAEIDLAKLSVTYHRLEPVSTRRLAHVEKSLNGPTRYASWLGQGRLAIAGTNATTLVSRNKTVKETWSPAGVAVVDTGTWRSRMIDPEASWFSIADGALLTSTARVVKVYETDGTLRFATKVDDNTGYVVAFAGGAYVFGEQRVTILDLQSGAVVSEIPNPHLYVLGADD